MNSYRVVVTNHCKVRAKQRLKLFLRQHELEDIETFIRKEFNKAHKCPRFNNTPFYKNLAGGVEIYVTKFVKFYTIQDNGVILIKTIVKNRGEWRY